eukprot:scaffold191869_cov29-Tisochrysis_lutea.AAC.2
MAPLTHSRACLQAGEVGGGSGNQMPVGAMAALHTPLLDTSSTQSPREEGICTSHGKTRASLRAMHSGECRHSAHGCVGRRCLATDEVQAPVIEPPRHPL